MKSVYFRPWVGANYEAEFRGQRVLVLGESHYQWDEEIKAYEGLTIDCVNEQLNGERSKFWTNIQIAFLGAYPSLTDKHEFWRSVAFYNYVQQFAGFGPRVSPSKESWENSERAFWEVLEVLKPNCIIALGYRLWDNLPSEGRRRPDVLDAPKSGRWTWWYPTPKSESRPLAYAIRHPSAGFSGIAWRPHVMTALRLSGEA